MINGNNLECLDDTLNLDKSNRTEWLFLSIQWVLHNFHEGTHEGWLEISSWMNYVDEYMQKWPMVDCNPSATLGIIIVLCNLATLEPFSLAPEPLGIYYVYKDVIVSSNVILGLTPFLQQTQSLVKLVPYDLLWI